MAAYYRITYRCEMRNTPEQQKEIDNKTRYFTPSDSTKDYTESENVQAGTQPEAYAHGRNVAAEKTAKYFNQDNMPKKSVWGFTVKYSVKSPDDVVYIGETLVNDDAKTLHYSFAIDRMTVFEVNYYRCGGNKTMHFSTSAARFNQPKTDWNQCGQAQKDLLPKGSAARRFYRKWDDKHLKELGDAEYAELLQDLNELERHYAYIEAPHAKNGVSFYDQKNFSMEIPRGYNAMGGNLMGKD